MKKTARETAERGGREKGRLPSAALPPRVLVRGHWRSLRTYTVPRNPILNLVFFRFDKEENPRMGHD